MEKLNILTKRLIKLGYFNAAPKGVIPLEVQEWLLTKHNICIYVIPRGAKGYTPIFTWSWYHRTTGKYYCDTMSEALIDGLIYATGKIKKK